MFLFLMDAVATINVFKFSNFKTPPPLPHFSDQTDLSDLMGNDMPMAALNLDKENANVGGFAWCDGVFLRALKTGQWVLLDEMNLATQQVGIGVCYI